MDNRAAAEQYSTHEALEWMRDQAQELSGLVLFRGQRRAWPTIKPSICRESECTRRRLWNIMRWFCSHQSRFLTGYSIENAHDRLAVLQHYIGRSPVIDLTGTPEVALYFALKNSKLGQECVVYAVNTGSAGGSDIVFSDHDFLALPFNEGGNRHRWWRQDGYTVGPKEWRDLDAVDDFDLLALDGVSSLRFRKQKSEDAFVSDLGDLESIADDPLAYLVRGSVQAIARSLGILTSDIQAILEQSATADPDTEMSSRIENLILLANQVDAPSEVFPVLESLKAAWDRHHWDTSFDASLLWAEQEIWHFSTS